MRLTFGLEPWRIGLIVAGLGLAFAGTLGLAGPPGARTSVWHEYAPAAAAVLGLLMVLAAFYGRQTTSTAGIGSNLSIGLLAVPLLFTVANLSPEWKVILGASAVVGIALAVVIARRRA
jgi:hypothetical protein